MIRIFLCRIYMVVCALVVATSISYAQETERSVHDNSVVKRLEKKEIRRQRRNAKHSLEGELQLSGAFALYPMATKWATEFTRLYPRVKIDISAGGSGKGITDALSGMVDIGMVSRELTHGEMNLGAVVVPVVQDAIVLVTNAKNPDILEIMTRGVSFQEVILLWRGDKKFTWGELLGGGSTNPVHLYTRADASGASETMAHIVGVAAEKLSGTAVYSDPGIASVVQRDKLALGYTSMAYAYNLRSGKFHRGIFVVPLDLNNDGVISTKESYYMNLDSFRDAVIDGRYPTPPARNLFFVYSTKNTNPLIEAFVEFILSDGQFYAPQSGYIPIGN